MARAPPHLHPRSRMTSSLFAATVVASFFVVALPHALPCPAPRRVFADGEVIVDANGKKRRRKKPQEPQIKDGIAHFDSLEAPIEKTDPTALRRECPVPKPGGLVGEILGFNKKPGSPSPGSPGPTGSTATTRSTTDDEKYTNR